MKAVALPVTNLAMFVTFVGATRDVIAKAGGGGDQQWEGMNREGALWFHDLTMADSTMLLPILAITSSWIGLELALGGGGGGAGAQPSLIRSLKFLAQSTLVLSMPFVAQLPAGVFMYWIPSSLFSIAQGIILRSGRQQRRLVLPQRGTAEARTSTKR
jgi:YidC/Oxa1 family membrane protein insertase